METNCFVLFFYVPVAYILYLRNPRVYSNSPSILGCFTDFILLYAKRKIRTISFSNRRKVTQTKLNLFLSSRIVSILNCETLTLPDNKRSFP
jgi:hypothetical protein